MMAHGSDRPTRSPRSGHGLKVLHIAPHFDGRVGAAHAALAEAAAASRGAARHMRHSYVLLDGTGETPNTARIAAAGGSILVRPDVRRISELVAEADVVQVEWWNHPRLFALLATTRLPPMRLLVWLHMLGLAPPRIPAGLAAAADRTLFTSPCTPTVADLAPLVAARQDAFDLAPASFGLAPAERPACPTAPLKYGYVGPLDFKTMHPGFFDAVDAMTSPVRISLWGTLDPLGEVAARAAAMRHPARIRFEGPAAQPETVLRKLDVLVHLLTPGHDGTSEPTLVEAMSVGVAPVIWRNAPEEAVVQNGRNGCIVDGIEECATMLDWMHGHPRRVARLGAKGIYDMARLRTPEATLRTLTRAQAALAALPRRSHDFAAALGVEPRNWILSTLPRPADADARRITGPATPAYRSGTPQDGYGAGLAGA
ncbi:glycosyltransferase [Xanthobacteraceae bacterium A53D]